MYIDVNGWTWYEASTKVKHRMRCMSPTALLVCDQRLAATTWLSHLHVTRCRPTPCGACQNNGYEFFFGDRQRTIWNPPWIPTSHVHSQPFKELRRPKHRCSHTCRPLSLSLTLVVHEDDAEAGVMNNPTSDLFLSLCGEAYWSILNPPIQYNFGKSPSIVFFFF